MNREKARTISRNIMEEDKELFTKSSDVNYIEELQKEFVINELMTIISDELTKDDTN